MKKRGVPNADMSVRHSEPPQPIPSTKENRHEDDPTNFPEYRFVLLPVRIPSPRSYRSPLEAQYRLLPAGGP